MKLLSAGARLALTLVRAAAALLLVNMGAGLAGEASPGKPAFDPPEVRAASDVVPPVLLHGAHYQVGPTVRTFAFMNRYSVISDYGAFAPPSDARLRRLIREIAAIAELQKIHQSDAFAKAAVAAGKGVVQGAQNLIEDPVATISAVPEAVFSVFGRVSESAKRGGRSKYEDGVAQNLLAVSSFKREYAQKFDVDVYSTNEVLQKELNSVAWASAAGNLTLGAASMVTGATVLQVAGGLRSLETAKNIVNALPAAELSRRNRESLRQMRVPALIADAFLQNPLLSPRHQTVIIEGMKVLHGVPGRAVFIQYASRANTERFRLGVPGDGGASRRLSPVGSPHPAPSPLSEHSGRLHQQGIRGAASANRSATVDRADLGDRDQLGPDNTAAAAGPACRGVDNRRRVGASPRRAPAPRDRVGRARGKAPTSTGLIGELSTLSVSSRCFSNQ